MINIVRGSIWFLLYYSVLKTHYEVHKFLETRHNPFTFFKLPYSLKKIDNIDHF